MALPQILFPDQIKDLIASSQSEEFASLMDLTYEVKLQECLDEEKLPFLDESIGNFTCYPPLEQGPCLDKEWLVLDNDLQMPKLKCVKRVCDENFVLVQNQNGTKECAVLKSINVCGHGMHVLANPFGKGKLLKRLLNKAWSEDFIENASRWRHSESFSRQSVFKAS